MSACVHWLKQRWKQGFLINDISFRGRGGVTRREKEQQIEISVGADESETRIGTPINFSWSKVHAISPMLCDNELKLQSKWVGLLMLLFK